jgi:quercetin dioxygenase-like cupin family protein
MKHEQATRNKKKTVSLNEKQIMSFKKPFEIFVTSGKIWVTTSGDSQDYIYGEGDCVKLPSDKHTVIQAMGRASFWF